MEFVDIFNETTYLFGCLNNDIKKLIIVNMLKSKIINLNMKDINNYYAYSLDKKNGINNDKKNILSNNQIVRDEKMFNDDKINELIWNNYDLWRYIWLRDIGTKLPECNNLVELKNKYMTIVDRYYNNISLQNKEYDILYNLQLKNFELENCLDYIFYSGSNSNIYSGIPFDQQKFHENCNKIKKLMSNGADINIYISNLDLLETLEFDIDEDLPGEYYFDFIIKNGYDVNKIHKNGKTLLEYFCLSGETNSVNYVTKLLQSGANPNIKDNQGKTILNKILICNKTYNIIEWLIIYNADINAIHNNSLSDYDYKFILKIVEKHQIIIDQYIKKSKI